MLRRVGVTLLLGLSACKPTIIHDPAPAPASTPIGPVADPLVVHAAVRDAVERYTAAIERRDVVAASACVVPETFTLYEDLRLAASRSTREQLESWGLLSILMVLQIRSTVAKSALEQIDGRVLFEFAVSSGLVGAGLDGIDLDDVRLGDDGTSAEIWFEGAPIVWLRETDGGWQIDIPHMVELLNPAIEASAREQVSADGRVRTAYTLLTLSTRTPIDFSVVDGPLELEREPSDAPDSAPDSPD